MIEGAFDTRLDAWKSRQQSHLMSTNIKKRLDTNASRPLPEDALAAALFNEQNGEGEAQMASHDWALYAQLFNQQAVDVAKEGLTLPENSEDEE
jgi:hypothetical protein